MRGTVSRLRTMCRSRPIPSRGFPALGTAQPSDLGIPGCNRRDLVARPATLEGMQFRNFGSRRSRTPRDPGQDGFAVLAHPHVLQRRNRQHERYRVRSRPKLGNHCASVRGEGRAWYLIDSERQILPDTARRHATLAFDSGNGGASMLTDAPEAVPAPIRRITTTNPNRTNWSRAPANRLSWPGCCSTPDRTASKLP